MRFWNHLRSFDAGEWIAFAFFGAGSFVVLWGTSARLLAAAFQGATLPVPLDGGAPDLLAQQNMAAASWWMVGLTAISAAIGALSLFLIFRTLLEAKRSADAAHSAVEATLLIGKRQVRAYLDIEDPVAKIDRMQFVLTVDARLSNSGQSPARAIQGTAILRFVEFQSLPDGEMDTHALAEVSTTFSASAVSAGKEIGLYLTFGVYGIEPRMRALFNGYSPRAIEIDVSLDYTDVFDDRTTLRRMLGAFVPEVEKMREGVPMRVSTIDG